MGNNTETYSEGDVLEITFSTAVDDEREEEVTVIDSTPDTGMLHVETNRTDGPCFFLHENGNVTLQSKKVDITSENWGSDLSINNKN